MKRNLITSRKTLLLTSLLVLGLATGCKSKGDSPRVEPGKENPQKPDDPKKPDEPKKPDQPDTPADPKKPSDNLMATRMIVEVNKGKTAELLRTLKIEEFAWGGDKNAITLQDLLPFVTFSSSLTDGTPYILTAEDLKLLKLEDMKYEKGAHGDDAITFKVRYNGILGRDALSLSISRRDYFLQKFTIDPAFAPKHYLAGVAKEVTTFTEDLFPSYDAEKYGLQLIDAQADHAGNVLTFRGKVILKRYHSAEAITLDFSTAGFKPLSTLKGNLMLATTGELNEWMRKKLGDNKPIKNEALLALIKPSVQVWLPLSGVSLRLSDQEAAYLSWNDHGRNIKGVRSGGHDTRDLFLQNVSFQVTSATYDKAAATLTIGLTLLVANEQALDDVTATLVVRSQNF